MCMRLGVAEEVVASSRSIGYMEFVYLHFWFSVYWVCNEFGRKAFDARHVVTMKQVVVP